MSSKSFLARRRDRRLLLLILIFSLSSLILWRQHRRPPADKATTPIELPPPPPVDPREIIVLLERDEIQAIDEPQLETAVEASGQMKSEERVVGLVINSDARAYPIPVLSVHEIVNDVVGGEPVAITWCPLCYSALVFGRTLEKEAQLLSFGVSGRLLRNTLVMFDRQTNTLWSQLYGGAIDGPLAGRSLSVYPSVLTEWSSWLAQHPDTLVLSKTLTCAQFSCGSYSSSPRGSYQVDPYLSYYNSPDAGVIEHQIPRGVESSSAKQRVLGIRLGEEARAYPFEILNHATLVNDQLGDAPVLTWFDPETETGAAFLRWIDGLELTFEADPARPDLIVDRETGSHWQMPGGGAISGRLRGAQLSPLVTTTAFEFGWYDYFPSSDTYGLNQ